MALHYIPKKKLASIEATLYPGLFFLVTTVLILKYF